MLKKILTLICILSITVYSLAFADVFVDDDIAWDDITDVYVQYGETYNTEGEVSLYLCAFRELPSNYITKADASALGWVSSQGNLWDVAYGCSIGGDTFGNREGLLPSWYGITWHECDINYEGGFRGSDRILYSSDGLIYSTYDHYNTFTLLYDGWYEPEEEAAQ